jgi:FAD dependent oxidoreductase TIGR03364
MAVNKSAIVVGAGIVGLASARALSLQGYRVTIIERTERAVGASIRNFGMLWPIGQPDGVLYERALRSKNIWKEVADSVGLWYEECGSLHLATNKEEWKVLQELLIGFQASNRPCSLMSPEEIKNNYKGIQTKEIMGGLFSPTETIVDPREAIAATASYLEEYLDVKFIWGKNISEVGTGKLRAGNETFEADLIVICNGADFETLFPEIFEALPITKCKLQMMRFMPGANEKRMGVSVCGGLSLIHYQSFKIAPSLKALEEKYKQEMPEYIKWGIHVMVSQNDRGELTVGDSHEYGNTHDPFDRAIVNQLIMQYLSQLVPYDEWTLLQSWNGVYAKMKNGETEIFLNPLPGVFILNGVGGAGMTLSFGLAEEKLANI